MRLSQMQRQVLAELLRMALDMESREEADFLTDHLVALRHRGEDSAEIMRWISLLPRARGSAQVVVRRTMRARVTFPPHIDGALNGTRGAWNGRHVREWLMNPEAPAPRNHATRGANLIVQCAVCKEPFERPQRAGRPPSVCSDECRAARGTGGYRSEGRTA